jgi:hypothetical protein
MRDTQLTGLSVARPGIRSIVIDPTWSQSPAFGGVSFGSVGQYEKLRGIAYGEIDPADPRNAIITDLHLAPVNDRGMVEYSMDIFIPSRSISMPAIIGCSLTSTIVGKCR